MRNYIFLFCTICWSSIAFSQLIEDIEAVTTDLIFLSKDYITPAAKGVAHQTTNGWLSTTKAAQPWQVDIALQGNMLFLPNKYKTFNVNENQLNNLTIQGSATSATIPTALGGDDIIVFEGEIDDEQFQFDAPEGINDNHVFHSQLQATIHTYFGTALIVRVSPKIKIKDTDYNTFGVGLQHNISQWFNKESTWQFSTLIYYSSFNLEDKFSDADLVIGSINGIIAKGNTFGFNLISTKHLGNFSIHSAINITTNNFNYEVAGNGELILNVLNNALNDVSTTKTFTTLNLGADYRFHNFSVNSSVSIGKFTNLMLGLNYSFLRASK